MSNATDTGFLARGGIWVVVQFVLMAAVLVLGVMFPGDRTCGPVIILGAGLLVMGGYVGIAGVIVLGRNRTPFPKPREHSALVAHGIYSRMRHPLYTSVMLVSLGWALLWQSAESLAVALGLIAFFQAKARREEHWLVEKFPGYADYAKRVPRFMPRPRTGGKLTCNL